MSSGWEDKNTALWQRVKDLWQRFKDGMAEVILSLAGAVGIIRGISAVRAFDDVNLTTGQAFHSCFEGGQININALDLNRDEYLPGSAGIGKLYRKMMADMGREA